MIQNDTNQKNMSQNDTKHLWSLLPHQYPWAGADSTAYFIIKVSIDEVVNNGRSSQGFFPYSPSVFYRFGAQQILFNKLFNL